MGTVTAASPRFRDEVVQLGLHAGFSVTFDLEQPSTSGLERWQVRLSESAQETEPTLSCQQRVQASGLTAARCWCVSVPTAEQLIMVRKVQRVRPRAGRLACRSPRSQPASDRRQHAVQMRQQRTLRPSNGIAAQWWSASQRRDTRVLTSSGLLFLSEIEDRLRAGQAPCCTAATS